MLDVGKGISATTGNVSLYAGQGAIRIAGDGIATQGGAATLVKLTYQISRRMSVIARGGTDTALDVHYGFSFR